MSGDGLAITTGGVAQLLFGGAVPVGGFEVCNVDLFEELWLSDTTSASVGGSGCYRLPGGGYTYSSPYGYKPLGPVSVVALTTGHKVTARKWLMPPDISEVVVSNTECPVCPVTVVNPASGSTVKMEITHRSLYVNNNAELPALTIWMPPDAMPGEMVEVGFAHPITVLAVRNAIGGALAGTPTDAYGPGDAIHFRYIDGLGWVYWK
jgi:hypothetical protein